MQTGFVPADFVGPIRIEITGITGVDFAAERICPPPGWNATSPGDWKPPEMQDIFIVLSQVEELSSPSPSPSPSPIPYPHGRSRNSPADVLFVFVLLFCFCCCCCYLSMPSSEPEPETTTYTYTTRTLHPTATAQAVRGFELTTMQASAPPMATAVSPAGAALPNGSNSMESFLDHQAYEGPYTWRSLLPREVPRMENDYLVGPWGDAIFAAVEFERDNPDWSIDPRYQGGAVGQVIDYLQPCGQSRFHEQAEMTEHRVKEHLGLEIAPASPVMVSAMPVAAAVPVAAAAVPVAVATPVARATVVGSDHIMSFLDHAAYRGPEAWRSLLPREIPKVKRDYLVGHWGRAIQAAVEFEHDNPDWIDDPRYQGGPAGQVIDYLGALGQSQFQALAETTEQRFRDSLGMDSSSGSSSDGAPLMVTMSCTVPAGVYPGQMISVSTSQGQVQIQVPFNKRPGDMFEFEIPATR